MTKQSITAAQRYTRGRPCPICGGFDAAPRGHGKRCSGYHSADGEYAYCTREEYAGAIEPNTRTAPPAFAHRLHGDCRCGVTHGPALAAPQRATRAPRTRRAGSASSSSAAASANASAGRPGNMRYIYTEPAPAAAPAIPAAGSASSSSTAAPVPAIAAPGVAPVVPDALARVTDPAEGVEAAEAVTSSSSRQDAGEQLRTLTATYEYRDAAGALVFQVLRYQLTDSATGEVMGKTFRQRRPDPERRGAWLWNLDGVTRPPYRLRELLDTAAADPAAGIPVYLCEGEKDADALAALGLAATTTAQGARSWEKSAEGARAALAGRHVVILPDHDTDGALYADMAARALYGVAASVRVLSLAAADPAAAIAAHGDVSDWIAAGGTAERLAQLAAAAPAYVPAPEPAPERAPSSPAPARGGLDGSGGRPGGPGMQPPAPLPALVELYPAGVYCTPARDMLVRRSRREDGGTASGEGLPGYDVANVSHYGMPRLLSVWRAAGASERKATEETYYTLEWSGLGAEQAPITVTGEDLAGGAAWAHWPGLPITSRPERDFWANIVKSQVGAFRVPVGIAQRRTGWIQDPASGVWRCYKRDGRTLDDLQGAQPIPIDGYTLPAKRARAWAEGMPTLPDTPPSPADLAALMAFAQRVDGLGRLHILLGAAARALIATFRPAETAVFAVGDTRSGKTSEMQFSAGGVDGPCPYKAEPDCRFTGTLPGLEQSLAPLHDLPAFVDDFHILPTDGRARIEKMGAIIDVLVTGAADGGELRPLGTRSGRKRQGATLGGLPFVSSEGLTATNISRLLRVIYLAYREGEADTAELAEGWAAHQAIWTRAGHAVLRWVAAHVNAPDAGEFLAQLREREAAYTRALREGLAAMLPHARGQWLDSLAPAYARPALGLWLVEVACGLLDMDSAADGPYSGPLLAVLLHHASAQYRMIECGGPGQQSPRWILDMTRNALDNRAAHLRGMGGQPLTETEDTGPLTRYGYQHTGLSGWGDCGPTLGYLDMADGYAYLDPDVWRRILTAQAHRPGAGELGMAADWTPQTFPAYVVALGLAHPESGSGRACRRVSLGTDKAEGGPGKRIQRRLLAVPLALLYGEESDGDGEESDGDDDAQDCAPPAAHLSIGENERSQRSQRSQDAQAPMASGTEAPASCDRSTGPAVTAVTPQQLGEALPDSSPQPPDTWEPAPDGDAVAAWEYADDAPAPGAEALDGAEGVEDAPASWAWWNDSDTDGGEL